MMFTDNHQLLVSTFGLIASTLLLSAATTDLYDGWSNDYAAGSNRTVFAAGLARPGAAGADPYYRYVDGDAASSEVQHFSATGGIDGVPTGYTGPTLYGGAAYRDNVRPDDSASFAGTVLSIRNNSNDVKDSGGQVGDPIRAYIPGDSSGLSFDEAFGAVLFDFAGGAGLQSLAWTGATNSNTLTATVRWAVLDGGVLYVSNDSFTVEDTGVGGPPAWDQAETNELSDVTAATWAAWDPSGDLAEMKFSATAHSYAAVAFSDVTMVGYVWELSDSENSTNYLDMIQFSATKQAVAPVLNSAATSFGNVGIPFSYQIEATDAPTSYGVTGTLPDGLSLNTATGEISGTPTTEEVRTVTISATNAEGTGTASLEITIGPELFVPEITSPAAAAASAGGEFTYQVDASYTPTTFSASGLPKGLSLDPASGVISGVAMEAGTFEVTLTASNDAGESDVFLLSLTVDPLKRDEIPGGRTYRCYFLGNSLTLSLSTAPQPELARLERVFAAHGNRLEFGATLGAGVNLDQHWVGQLYDGQWMKQGVFDDGHEYSVSNGWAGPGAEFGTTMFRDYNFALQGKRRDYDGTIVEGEVFDALVLQPYVAYLEPQSYVAGMTVQPLGDRQAISNFIYYASGNNPSAHEAVRDYYIYTAWPQLIGIEYAAIDTDGNGVYSFSEFYDQAYEPPVNPVIAENPREHVPCRDYVTALHDAVRGDHPDLADRIHVIPVGEVFAELDRLIRTDALTGFETYFNRMEAYYLNARLNGSANLEDANFIWIYPPNEPENFQNGFIREQGIKNIYADGIHWNNQTHNDPDSGTIGAYVAAATIHAVITGENPDRMSPEAVATYYEAFDAGDDAALIRQLQAVIWQVVTSTDWHGVNYAERTGLGARTEAMRSYRDFAAAHFSLAELADPLVSGEEADFDGDGDSNLEEFFRLGDPTMPDTASLLSIVPGEGTTDCAFTGVSRPVGLLPALELSDDLTSWNRLDAGALRTVPSGVTGKDAYSATVDTPGDKQFFRVALPYVPDRELLPLVAWGPSAAMVGSNQNTGGLNAATLDLSTPANPAIGAGYDTYSPVFFAAASATGAANTCDIIRINDNAYPEDGTGDALLLKWTSGDGTDNAGVMTMLWTQDGDSGVGGFLNGADTGDVHLADMEVRAKVGFGSGSVSQMRFVIRKDGQFYISGDRGCVTSVNLAGANDAPYERIELPNPHGVEWFAYDPTVDPLAIGEPVAFDRFDGITAVGFNWRSSGDESLRYLYIEAFRADFYP